MVRTTKAAKAAVAASVTPEKDNKRKAPAKARSNHSKKPKVVVIKMKGGYQNTFTNTDEVDKFCAHFKDDIVEKLMFATVKEHKDWDKKEKADQKVITSDAPAIPSSVSKDEKLSAAEKKLLDKINSRRRDIMPTNRIEVYYNINETSTKAIVILRHKDLNGKDFWMHKANYFIMTIKSMNNVKPSERPEINEFIQSLEEASIRDIHGGINDSQHNVSKKNGKIYDDKLPYGAFSLDTKRFVNPKQEEEYVQTVCSDLARYLLDTQKSTIYKLALADAINDSNPGFYASMTKPQSGQSMEDYIKSCNVYISECTKLVEQIVHDQCGALRAIHYQNFVADKYQKVGTRNSRASDKSEEEKDEHSDEESEQPTEPQETKQDDSDDEQLQHQPEDGEHFEQALEDQEDEKQD